MGPVPRPPATAHVRVFRSATHPEFIAYEIEPALVAAELPTSLAETVARVCDETGWSVGYVVANFKACLAAYEVDDDPR